VRRSGPLGRADPAQGRIAFVSALEIAAVDYDADLD